jgi:translation initiation factor IF-3
VYVDDNHYFLSPYNLRPQYKGNQVKDTRTKINHAIKAPELRVITALGENLGTLSLADALKAAEERKLDLIEISPNAVPPVAKIMDYGKYRYETGRKAREVKAKSHVTETKSVQVKIGTGDHDQQLKAKRTAEWLEEGHRVKIDLFLWGRYKYMEQEFLKERLERFLKIIPTDYKIADPMKKSPKGWSTTLERVAANKNSKPKILAVEEKPHAAKKTEAPSLKSKKKSLDELLEAGLL